MGKWIARKYVKAITLLAHTLAEDGYDGLCNPDTECFCYEDSLGVNCTTDDNISKCLAGYWNGSVIIPDPPQEPDGA